MIEEAVRLKEQCVVNEVVTVTIGPETCGQTIQQTLAMCAIRTIRIWDETLADANLLNISTKTTLLEAVVADEQPDIILTGVQPGDDSFMATGVYLANAVGFQWAAVVNALDIVATAGIASVHRGPEAASRN